MLLYFYYFNYSPLIYAIFSGSIETVKFFMNLNIKEIRDMDENPLHFAAITNQIEIGKLFIEKYKVNSTDKQGHTPLMFAIKNHAKEFIQFLLQQPEIDINLQDKINIYLF